MNKTGSVAKGGMYTALTLILLYAANILPTSRLTFFALASGIIPLSILTTNIKNSIVVYASSGILALLLGLRGTAFVYIIFFGLYGFVKYYLERLRKLPVEWILKLLFFNLTFYISYTLYRTLLLPVQEKKFPLYLLIIMLQIAFVIYDYVMSLIIGYIMRRFVK